LAICLFCLIFSYQFEIVKTFAGTLVKLVTLVLNMALYIDQIGIESFHA